MVTQQSLDLFFLVRVQVAQQNEGAIKVGTLVLL